MLRVILIIALSYHMDIYKLPLFNTVLRAVNNLDNHLFLEYNTENVKVYSNEEIHGNFHEKIKW